MNFIISEEKEKSIGYLRNLAYLFTSLTKHPKKTFLSLNIFGGIRRSSNTSAAEAETFAGRERKCDFHRRADPHVKCASYPLF